MFTELLDRVPGTLHGFAPFPLARDRAAWNGLPADLRAEIVARGEGLARPGVFRAARRRPIWTSSAPATAAASRSSISTAGDSWRLWRSPNASRARGGFSTASSTASGRSRKRAAGRSRRTMPISADTPQIILPDAQRPVVDLFAAETGALMAMVRYLLGAELDAVSPLIHRAHRARDRDAHRHAVPHRALLVDGARATSR